MIVKWILRTVYQVSLSTKRSNYFFGYKDSIIAWSLLVGEVRRIRRLIRQSKKRKECTLMRSKISLVSLKNSITSPIFPYTSGFPFAAILRSSCSEMLSMALNQTGLKSSMTLTIKIIGSKIIGYGIGWKKIIPIRL